MTIQEAIDRVDELKPNQYTDAEKLKWLSELDGRVDRDILSNYEGYVPGAYEEYDEETDPNMELLVEPPYDEMYIHFLMSKIDYHNAEYTRYNNSANMFNTMFAGYAQEYLKTHMPIRKSFRNVL